MQLTCWKCGEKQAIGHLVQLCPCGGPLRVDYNIERIRAVVTPEQLRARPKGMWRFREILPLPPQAAPVSLGEGDAPLILSPVLAARYGLAELRIKDEAVNPTGSFKARGMAAAISMAKHLGAKELAAPSAGNAGGAMAAYAAAAGLRAHVYLPRDVPEINRLECQLAGAEVTLIDGLIDDCGRVAAEACARNGWFNLSTLKEPYRVEGKKIMGYELVEQYGGRLPDVILYPAGGGTGLIGMAKAFDEMEALGWIGRERPRFVVVQAAGCAPIVRAFERGDQRAERWENAQTAAAGLRVPQAIGDFIMLDILRRTHGTAIAVEEEALVVSMRELAAATGIAACPEGGACLAALRFLREGGCIRGEERVVLFNTGSGLKYVETLRP